MDTSRNASLDHLLAIWNLLALADHKEEEIMNLMEEDASVDSLEWADEETKVNMHENIRAEIVRNRNEISSLYTLRKNCQRNFFQIYWIDKDYWCQFKHFAVTLVALEEVRNANPTYETELAVTQFRKLTYQFLGNIMWVWPANCWRCLADAYDNK